VRRVTRIGDTVTCLKYINLIPQMNFESAFNHKTAFLTDVGGRMLFCRDAGRDLNPQHFERAV